MDSVNDYPMVEELSDQDFETLSQIKEVADLKEVEVLDDWYDDHCPCVGVRINGVKVGFYWLTNYAAGAFYYPDSLKAQEMIVEIVTDYVAGTVRPSDDPCGDDEAGEI